MGKTSSQVRLRYSEKGLKESDLEVWVSVVNKNVNEGSNYAELNKPLGFVVFMLGVGFAVLNLQAAQADDNSSLLLSILYGFLAFLAILVTAYWVIDAFQTEVTDSYIRKGKVIIPWETVTDATANEFSIVIKASGKSVMVNYYAYRRPEELSNTIRTILSLQGIAV